LPKVALRPSATRCRMIRNPACQRGGMLARAYEGRGSGPIVDPPATMTGRERYDVRTSCVRRYNRSFKAFINCEGGAAMERNFFSDRRTTHKRGSCGEEALVPRAMQSLWLARYQIPAVVMLSRPEMKRVRSAPLNARCHNLA
jgi:hypothetical protein